MMIVKWKNFNQCIKYILSINQQNSAQLFLNKENNWNDGDKTVHPLDCFSSDNLW